MLKNLRSLAFFQTDELSDEAYNSGFGASDLAYLSVYESPLTNVALAGIAARHSHLRTLSFGSCDVITDEELENLLDGEPHLVGLDFFGCSRSIEKSSHTFESSCRRLRRLV